MLIRTACLLFSAVLLAVLGACTEGPNYQEALAAQSPVSGGQGRIAVFRTQQVQGMAVKPIVMVDGVPTGKCEANAVFFVDVPPGQYTLSASTMESTVTQVNVSAGKTSYVLCTIEIGALMGVPKLVPVSPESAVPKMKDLVFTGQY